MGTRVKKREGVRKLRRYTPDERRAARHRRTQSSMGLYIGSPRHHSSTRPRDAIAYISRGHVKSVKGDLDGALADYTRAIEIDASHAMAYSSRGGVKWSSRDFAGAASDFKKTLEIDPANDYAKFFLFLAQALGPDGESAASATYKASLATRGKPIEKGAWVGFVDRFLRGEIAAESLEKAAQTAPEAERPGNLCEAYFYSGMVAWIRGDKPAAMALLERCIATKKSTFTEYSAARAVLKWPR